MRNGPDELIPTRQSLLTRLKDWDDQESWREFFNTYWKLIYGVALKAGMNEQEAQEVVQETVISVARRMKDFKYDPALGSFKSWLLQLTRWRIYDQYRKREKHAIAHTPRSDLTPRTATVERVPDPAGLNLDRVWDQEWQRNLIDAALERVKRKVKPKQYQIFDLYVLKKWPVGKVTRTLGVSLAQVYLSKHRVSRLLRKEIEYIESKII
ncbi:MAG: sigma-70 family RNA polymerase sigma factor [Verrucomicrobiota bacterium]|jgi:RNA polymerase sigma factor (sigma-70 family)